MIRPRSIDLLGIGLLLGLPAAAYWLMVAPAFRENLAAAAMTEELAQQRTAQESVERLLNAVKTATRGATTRPALTLSSANDLNRRLTELNDLATSDSLQIDSLAPADAVTHERYVAIPIALSGQGTYRSCQRWLSDLKASAPDVAVSQLQIASTMTDKNGMVRITATLQWYALPAARK